MLSVRSLRKLQERFATFLEDELFEPLGMEDTQFVLGPLQVPRTSDIYGSQPVQATVPFVELGQLQPDGIDWKIQNVVPAAFYQQTPAFYSGGGGILSTADDFAKYLMMIANQGSLNGVGIVSPETSRLHTRPLITAICLAKLLVKPPSI